MPHFLALSEYDMRFGGAERCEEQSHTPDAVTKHPKVKLKIILSNHQFEAGGSISGALEVTSCTSQRLRLGEIAVELEAFEELNSLDHSATQIFLFNRTLFQGDHLPPSNAVLPAAPVHGHWTARKGRTTFPFSFSLPKSVPSSVTFAGNAHLRYIVKGSAQTWWNDTKSLVNVRSETTVLEKWQDEFHSRYLEPVEAVADSHIFMGGNGTVWLEAGVSEQLFRAGDRAIIRAGIKNNTKRQISGIKVTIARRLILGTPAQRQAMEPQITEVMHTQLFKGPQFEFPPGKEVMTNLSVEIPADIRTIRKTRLFEVEIIAQISAQLGNFAKDLTVEIPIYVAHPSSLSSRENQVVSLEPFQGPPQRSRSAMSQHGYHVAPSFSFDAFNPYVPHNMLSIPFPSQPSDPQMIMHLHNYADYRDWPPAVLAAPHSAPPSRTTSAAANFTTQLLDFNDSHNTQVSPIYNQNQCSDRPFSAMNFVRSHSPASSWAFNDDYKQISNEKYRQEQRGEEISFRSTVWDQTESAHFVAVPPSPFPSTPSSSLPMSGITVSQLLNIGAIPLAGLTTIQEDSESIIGTVKSVRDIRDSVNRKNVANLEAIASMAQEDDETIEVLESRQHFFAEEPEDCTVVEVTKSIKETRQEPAQIVAPSPIIEVEEQMEERKIMTLTHDRPASAQGMGLSALESRLRSQRESKPFCICANDNKRNKPVKAVEKRCKTESGALRAAAMAANRRQNDALEEVRRLEFEIEKQAKAAKVIEPVQSGIKRDVNQETSTPTNKMIVGSFYKASQAISSTNTPPRGSEKLARTIEESSLGRKFVNFNEQKKLNQEAVGRVTGWLCSSKSISSHKTDIELDSNKSTKTPSPSIVIDMRCAQFAQDSPPPNVQAVGLAKGEEEMTVLSADLRALIDSSNLNPPLKIGNASKSKSKLHQLTNQAIKGNNLDGETVSHGDQVKTLIAASKKDIAKVDQNDKATGGDEMKYDSRSARGGRGGKVASVANMWASIADGTDGSQVKKDEVPVLTLRPKAIRGNAAGSNKLDFSKLKRKIDEPSKPSAREIFYINSKEVGKDGPQVKAVYRESFPNPPLKTSKAAHFINTTLPKPVFAKTAYISPSPAKELTYGQENKIYGQLRGNRKIVSDMIAMEGKLKAGRDIEADKLESLPMNGRGTTKAIGRDKLADLKSLWGG